MAKTRINQSQATTFADELRKFTFKPAQDELKDREDSLYWQVYNFMHTQEEQRGMTALPDGWLRTHDCLRINAGGYSLELNHAERKPSPRFLERHFTEMRTYCNSRINLTNPDLIDKVQKFSHDGKKQNEESEKFYYKTLSMVKSFRNWEDIFATSPDMEPFIRQWVNLDKEPAKSLAPLANDVLASIRQVRGDKGIELAA
jgi:hypothetical protein